MNEYCQLCGDYCQLVTMGTARVCLSCLGTDRPTPSLVIGFAGTQRGLTVEQGDELLRGLRRATDTVLGPVVFVHGDCVGADEEAHWGALECGCTIEIWPCTIASKRAHCQGALVVHDPLPPLERNRRIAETCSYLIACPGEPDEQLRSGTWATVRYARAAGKRVWLVLPDGTVRGP